MLPGPPDLFALQSLMARIQQDHALLEQVKGTPQGACAYLKAEWDARRRAARMRLRGRR